MRTRSALRDVPQRTLMTVIHHSISEPISLDFGPA
jgi:hypothetical protein